MARIIKDYNAVYEDIGLPEVHSKVNNNKSRVKRSMTRLKEQLSLNNPKARVTLKSYYKIYKNLLEIKLRNRDLMILPFMIDKSVKVYNGKAYKTLKLKEEHTGKYLGEFAFTRTKGAHSSKGQSSDKIKR